MIKIRILIAGFYTPGIRAIERLLGMGYKVEQLRLLTHSHPRNRMLIDFAEINSIETQTVSVKSPEALRWVSDFQPDVLFSLYFRDIIPASILGVPRFGCVNLHPSLLPAYKGTFSVPWVLINGEEYTGFTYHYMVPKVDAGNIILQRRVAVEPRDTALSLYYRLLDLGLSCFEEVFRLVVEHRFPGLVQEGEGTYFSRRVPFQGYIDPAWSQEQIERFIRAMYFPPFKGALLKLPSGEEREILSLADYKQFTSLLEQP